MLLADSLVLGAINLDNLEVTVVLVGEVIPGGGKTLAVTAPGGIELNEGLAGSDNRVEGGISGNNDGSGIRVNSDGLSLGGRGGTELVTGVVLEESLEGIDGASTLVVSGSAINKHLQSRVSTDTEFLADSLVLSTVDLGDLVSIGLVSEIFPGGGKTLAVTAPGGIEFHHPDTRSDFIIEVVLSEVNNPSRGDANGDKSKQEDGERVHRCECSEKKKQKEKKHKAKKTRSRCFKVAGRG